MAVVEFGQALYYPYIHLRNPRWLKLAALYYDKLRRIVPFDFEPNDGGVAKVLRKELKFFDDIDPRNEAEELAPEFIAFARNYLSPTSRQKGLFNSIKRSIYRGSSLPPEFESLMQGREKFRIHPGKMARDLGEALIELGLAERAKDDFYGDFDLEPKTGALYMIFLARKMAEKRSLPIVTDDPIYQSLIHQPINLIPKTNASESKLDKGFTLASFAIETVVPKKIESVSFDQIAKFRQGHSRARQKFRKNVVGLAKDLDKLYHPESLEEYLGDHKKTIEDGVATLEDSLRSVGIDCIRNLFALSVPAWIGASWAAPLVAASPIIVPGAVTIAGALALVKWGIDRRRTLKASDYSYVLSLKRNLDVNRFMNQLRSGTMLF